MSHVIFEKRRARVRRAHDIGADESPLQMLQYLIPTLVKKPPPETERKNLGIP